MKKNVPAALTVSLDGLRVIEASAGTGKTWTITWLCLRLVVEKGLPIERILVVTFTRAATGELRDRVRRRLQDVLEYLEYLERRATAETKAETAETKADTEAEVVAYVQGLPDRELARARVTAALRGFDDAAIYTIHGLCQRALADRAFSSRMPFETEILPDVGETRARIVADFWRSRVASPVTEGEGALPFEAQVLFADWLLGKGVTPESFSGWLKPLLSKHKLKVRLPVRSYDLPRLVRDLRAGWLLLQKLWAAERNAIVTLLTDDPNLNRQSYRKSFIPNWASEVDGYLLGDALGWKLPKNFDRFTTTRIAGAAKNGPAPQHPFFIAAESFMQVHQALVEGFEWRLRRLRADLLDYVNAELPRRLAAERAQGYDDLLKNLDRALEGPEGVALARALEERYPAALIDEFQDTDPLQYAIFRRIYLEGAGPQSALFLVGDPKQAIYSFRGADLFAYLAAVGKCGKPMTLDRNQRSVPELVSALNALFQASARPFLLEGVPYKAVRAAEKQRDALVEAGRADEAPLRFFLCESGDKPANKGDAQAWAAELAAGEIARLLAAAGGGGIALGKRPLAAGDLAVLVGSHYQAHMVKQALLRHGITSAERSQDSVFQSLEAEQLERVLLACAEPRHEPRVRAALATDLFGLSAGQIAAFDGDEVLWEQRLQAFQHYHELWAREGFARMFRRLLLAESVVGRLAGYADGERRLTNLFQLGELLHAQASRVQGPEALIHWLASRRGEDTESEDAQLRLESDENLVQIVTIHAAKGLEYSITFVPFLWDAPSHVHPDKGVVFHDPKSDAGPVLDLLPEEDGEGVRRAKDEEKAERLRVAYVALTRAQNRCYVYWGNINQAGDSALGWLLHGSQVPGDAAIRARIEELAGKCDGALRIEPEPAAVRAEGVAAPAEAVLEARAVRRPLPAPWRLASFSSLVAAGREEWRAERPDHDQAVGRGDIVVTPTAPGGGRFAFPRGAEAGECLHRILERLDFGEPEKWAPVVAGELEQDGFSAEWAGEVALWLREILATPLSAAGDGAAFNLSQLPRAATLRELEFHLPLSAAKLGDLTRLFAAHGVVVPALGAGSLRGYLRGFVDLVFVHRGRFYLADWKSKWLGGTPGDYARERLGGAMDRAGYRLQYLLYATALHRYLKLRIPDYDYRRHFGGVYYFFLRGMHPEWRDGAGGAAGVFAATPPFELIDALDRIFAGSAAEGVAA